MGRTLGLGARTAILLVFAIFFIAPVLWLVLAPTKSDHALVTSSPFSFGSFHNVALAWRHLDAYSDHLDRRWIANTLIYSLSATAVTLAISVPAGFTDLPARARSPLQQSRSRLRARPANRVPDHPWSKPPRHHISQE